jgi:hypothetical protein
MLTNLAIAGDFNFWEGKSIVAIELLIMLLLIFGTAGMGYYLFTIALPGLRTGKLQARGANLFAVKKTSQILVWYGFLVPDVFDDALDQHNVA